MATSVFLTKDVWTTEVITTKIWTTGVQTSDVRTTDNWTTKIWSTDYCDFLANPKLKKFNFLVFFNEGFPYTDLS